MNAERGTMNEKQFIVHRSSCRVSPRRLLLLSALVWPLLAWAAARGLIVRAPLAAPADAVVLLSGSEVYRERAELGAQIFRAGRAARVVLTNDTEPGGWSHEHERTMLFVERAQEALERAGVPRERIEIVPQTVASTHDEALALRAYAQARGWRTLLFVTSGYHSRRAWWTVRRVFDGSGVRIGIEPCAPGAQTPALWRWWLSAAGWRMVAGEYVKMLYYRLRY